MYILSKNTTLLSALENTKIWGVGVGVESSLATRIHNSYMFICRGLSLVKTLAHEIYISWLFKMQVLMLIVVHNWVIASQSNKQLGSMKSFPYLSHCVYLTVGRKIDLTNRNFLWDSQGLNKWQGVSKMYTYSSQWLICRPVVK